jgi:hypothetical protein
MHFVVGCLFWWWMAVSFEWTGDWTELNCIVNCSMVFDLCIIIFGDGCMFCAAVCVKWSAAVCELLYVCSAVLLYASIYVWRAAACELELGLWPLYVNLSIFSYMWWVDLTYLYVLCGMVSFVTMRHANLNLNLLSIWNWCSFKFQFSAIWILFFVDIFWAIMGQFHHAIGLAQ